MRGARLDHGGVIASLRTDCGLMARIDTGLGPEAPERITPGDAVAALRLHGLGLAHRPWSVTSPCVAGKPRERWWREGLEAARCTRVQRGCPRDEAAAAGDHRWCEELALAVWAHAGRDLRGHHRDTTRVALPGAYVPARDAPARRMPAGDAQDHRPALPQAVVARLVSHDGGLPVVRQRWAGHPADTQGCRKRAAAVIRACQDTPRPRDRVAAAPRAGEDTATPRAPVGVITRLPAPLTWVSQVMGHARQGDPGPSGRATPRDQPRAWGHEGRAPRWLVGSSPAAVARADATRTHATPRADAAITTPRWPRHAPRVGTPAAAQEARGAWAQRGTSHRLASAPLTAHHRDAGQGRPTPPTPLQAPPGQLPAHVRADDDPLEPDTPPQACAVLGTPIDARAWRAAAVSAADTGPSHVAGGLRWLTDPRLVVSAWCVKPPHRMDGGRRGMTLAFLVDAVAPCRRRTP